MSLTKKYQLKKVALEFREYLEINFMNDHIEFKHFPNGSCFATSVLLSDFLDFKKLGNFELVFSSRNGKTHTWLQNKNLYLDITPDQFEEINKKVILIEKKNAYWHKTFDITEIRKVDSIDIINLNLMSCIKQIRQYL